MSEQYAGGNGFAKRTDLERERKLLVSRDEKGTDTLSQQRYRGNRARKRTRLLREQSHAVSEQRRKGNRLYE